MSVSEVFDAMLQSGFKETQTGRIILKDKTKADLEEVLRHLDLRGSAPPPVTNDNVELLLEFADQYQVTVLRNRCTSFIESLKWTDPARGLEL
eukprot:Skav202434  [mRNA]  locus=scaffold2070:69222:70729:+ [translate_table: standard]